MGKKLISIGLIVCTLMLFGCVSQHPLLTDIPMPLVEPEQTPTQFAVSFEPVSEQHDMDALGKEVCTEDHFMQYITLEQLRIYEYGGGTLLDGTIVNHYPKVLTGEMEIIFYEDDTKTTEVAKATLHQADMTLCLEPGEHAVYAEIETDMDIQLLPFTLITVTPWKPQD